jgi:hypothetical protein
MTKRLLTSSDDELELALLGSALDELPAGSGLKDTAIALGLSAATATALAAALPVSAAPLGGAASVSTSSLGVVSGALTAAAPPATVASVATTAGAASLATLGKAVVGGALVSFAVLTGVEHWASPSSNATAAPLAAPVRSPSPSASQLPRPGSRGAAAEEPAPPVLSPPPNSRVRSSVRRQAARGEAIEEAEAPRAAGSGQAAFEEEAPRLARAAMEASLAEETRLLERARAALDRGDPSDAAARLAEYRSRRPSGVLAQEAALLEVRLLLATGDRAAATERARALISRYPESAHAQTLRRLVAEQR